MSPNLMQYKIYNTTYKVLLSKKKEVWTESDQASNLTRSFQKLLEQINILRIQEGYNQQNPGGKSWKIKSQTL